MSAIQHKSLKAELLYLIGRSSAPLSGAELYEKCELADEIVQVSKAISNLVADGKIVRVEGEGRARYVLAVGVAAPAPAGKSGRSKAVQQDDAASGQPITGIRPLDIPTLCEQPVIDIPALGNELNPVRPDGEPGRTIEGQPFNDARLADAILARIKRDLVPLLRPSVNADLDVTTAPGAITISVERVEINISVGVGG